MSSTTLMISIHPKYARKIFSGEKKVELRKIKPRVIKGDQILVYVSSPEKSLQGVLRVNEVVSDTPKKLWEKVKNEAGISSAEFEDYYTKKEKGYGIYFVVEEEFSNPVSLERLRELFGRFHPPQSYRYFSNEDLAQYSSDLLNY